MRQAIAYGLDREELVARTVKQFDDRAEVLNNRIWLNNQPEYEDNAGEYATADKETATKTLEDAGYTKGSDGIYEKDGKRLSFRISTTGGNQLREDTEEVIQDQLKQIGIDIKIANVEGSAVFDLFFPESGDFADADYDIALFAWVGTPFTASSNQSLFIPGGGQNEMSYENAEVGTLFTEAIQTADREVTVREDERDRQDPLGGPAHDPALRQAHPAAVPATRSSTSSTTPAPTVRCGTQSPGASSSNRPAPVRRSERKEGPTTAWWSAPPASALRRSAMLGFIVRRLVTSLFVLFLASMLVFGAVSTAGRPAGEPAGRNPRTPPAVIEAKSRELNLDKPVPAALRASG